MKTIVLHAIGTAMSLDGFLQNEKAAAKSENNMEKWARLNNDIVRNQKHMDELYEKIKEIKNGNL